VSGGGGGTGSRKAHDPCTPAFPAPSSSPRLQRTCLCRTSRTRPKAPSPRTASGSRSDMRTSGLDARRDWKGVAARPPLADPRPPPLLDDAAAPEAAATPALPAAAEDDAAVPPLGVGGPSALPPPPALMCFVEALDAPPPMPNMAMRPLPLLPAPALPPDLPVGVVGPPAPPAAAAAPAAPEPEPAAMASVRGDAIIVRPPPCSSSSSGSRG
jgi:hypothetical protein